jgi:hypothetical protein
MQSHHPQQSLFAAHASPPFSRSQRFQVSNSTTENRIHFFPVHFGSFKFLGLLGVFATENVFVTVTVSELSLVVRVFQVKVGCTLNILALMEVRQRVYKMWRN